MTSFPRVSRLSALVLFSGLVCAPSWGEVAVGTCRPGTNGPGCKDKSMTATPSADNIVVNYVITGVARLGTNDGRTDVNAAKDDAWAQFKLAKASAEAECTQRGWAFITPTQWAGRTNNGADYPAGGILQALADFTDWKMSHGRNNLAGGVNGSISGAWFQCSSFACFDIVTYLTQTLGVAATPQEQQQISAAVTEAIAQSGGDQEVLFSTVSAAVESVVRPCDGDITSGRRLDACGVCGGDGSSCAITTPSEAPTFLGQ